MRAGFPISEENERNVGHPAFIAGLDVRNRNSNEGTVYRSVHVFGSRIQAVMAKWYSNIRSAKGMEVNKTAITVFHALVRNALPAICSPSLDA